MIRRLSFGVVGLVAVLGVAGLAAWVLASDDDDATVVGSIAPTEGAAPTHAFAPSIPRTPLPRATPLTPGPRPAPRADCFPGGCTSSADGPPTKAPAFLEWVLPFIPILEAREIRVAEIRGSHIEAWIDAADGNRGVFLVTNLGILELIRLPEGVSELDVSVQTNRGQAWEYSIYFGQTRVSGGSGTATTLEGEPIQFLVGSGLFGLAWSETLAVRATEALDGRRLH